MARKMTSRRCRTCFPLSAGNARSTSQVKWLKVSPSSLYIFRSVTRHTDWDMVFADDERESNPTSFKFLQMAHEWSKRAKSGAGPTSILAGLATTESQNGTAAARSSPAPQDGDVAASKDDAESDVASSDDD